MLRRLTALALLITLAGSIAACTPRTRGGQGGTMVVGAGLIAASALLFHSMSSNEEELAPGVPFEEGETQCLLGGCVLAGALGVLGLGLFIAGAAADVDEPAAPPERPEPTIADVATLSAGQPPSAHRPLPEVATDDVTLQLAKQARSAALRGDCDGADASMAAIAERDPRYYAALARSTVIDGCR